MPSTLFSMPMLLAAGVSASYIHAPLSAPKAQAFSVWSRTMKRVEYPDHPFVGTIPWYPYSMDLGVGTPAQSQPAVLSLTHSDIFILHEDVCTPDDDPELAPWVPDCSSGPFDDEESTTFNYNSSDIFFATYSYEKVLGYMMTDTIRIGSSQMGSASLGLALETTLGTGFFGLGTPGGSSGGYVFEERTPILDQMVSQEVIDSPAFSIYAEEEGKSTTGSILFGAVDKSKYDRKLQRIQASVGKDEFTQRTFDGKTTLINGYYANVSRVWKTESADAEAEEFVNANQGGTFYAAIDPTFTFTNVPQYVAEPIFMLNSYASIWHNIGMRTVPCDQTGNLNGSITFELGGEGGYRLTAHMRDLVVPAEEWHLIRPAREGAAEFVKHCLLGIQSVTNHEYFHYHGLAGTDWVIGNMVLKKTYMAFDAKNMEVGLAPLSSESDRKSDIVSFGSVGARVPDSEFVGYEECFGSDCAEEEEGEEDAGFHVISPKGLLMSLVLGAGVFIFFA